LGNGLVATDVGKYVIRTSDRISFKSCRQSWDYSSKIRQNYEPKALPKPLDFGTAIHSGLQVLYDPRTWEWDRDVVELAALQAFVKENRQALLRYEELSGPDELVRLDFAERDELGRGMLQNYFAWYRTHSNFTPVYVEVEFEVPIPVPPSLSLPPGFMRSRDGNLLHISPTYGGFGASFETEWWPVVYQGRIDMIVRDQHGRYWLVDHKTAAQLRQDVISFLGKDEQLKSYGWAIELMLGIPIVGCIYNELYKGVPSPPAENKSQRQGRWFSVNKMQDTTYELYEATVSREDRAAYEHGLYDDMLNYLKEQGNKYFRRTQADYTQREYEILGENICKEAIDMLNNPMIYPNPSRFKCGYCMMEAPCQARMEGSDEAMILQQLYVRRGTRFTEGPFTQTPQEEVTA
jgi:hypothetical protein